MKLMRMANRLAMSGMLALAAWTALGEQETYIKAAVIGVTLMFTCLFLICDEAMGKYIKADKRRRSVENCEHNVRDLSAFDMELTDLRKVV